MRCTMHGGDAFVCAPLVGPRRPAVHAYFGSSLRHRASELQRQARLFIQPFVALRTRRFVAGGSAVPDGLGGGNVRNKLRASQRLVMVDRGWSSVIPGSDTIQPVNGDLQVSPHAVPTSKLQKPVVLGYDGDSVVTEAKMMLSAATSALSPLILQKNHVVGKRHTEASRRKIGAANKGNVPWNKGKKHSPETRRKIAEATRRAMMRPETRRRLKQIATGRKHSLETRVKISNSCAISKSALVQNRAQTNAQELKSSLLQWRRRRLKRIRVQFQFLPEMIADLNFVIKDRMNKVLMDAKVASVPSPSAPKEKRRMPAETRAKLSERIKELWADPEYRERVALGLKQNLEKCGGRRKPLSEAHRERIRETLLRRNAERKGISVEESKRLALAKKSTQRMLSSARKRQSRNQIQGPSVVNSGTPRSARLTLGEVGAENIGRDRDAPATMKRTRKRAARVETSHRRGKGSDVIRRRAERRAEMSRMQSRLLLRSLASAGQLPPLGDEPVRDGFVLSARDSMAASHFVSGFAGPVFDDADASFPHDFDIYAPPAVADVDIPEIFDGGEIKPSSDIAISSFRDDYGVPERNRGLSGHRTNVRFDDPIETSRQTSGMMTDDIKPPGTTPVAAGRNIDECFEAEDDSIPSLAATFEEENEEDEEEDYEDYDDDYIANDAENDMSKVVISSNGTVRGNNHLMSPMPESLRPYSADGMEFGSKRTTQTSSMKRFVTYVNGKAEYVETE